MRSRMGLRGFVTSSSLILLGLFLGLLVSQFLSSSILSSSSSSSLAERDTVPTDAAKCPICDKSGSTSPSVEPRPSPSSSLLRKHVYRKNLKDNVRPSSVKEEYYTRKPLYVGVLTTNHFLNSRALIVNDTWGKYAPVIEYYTGEENSSYSTTGEKFKSSLPVVSLTGVTDIYPPFRKFFRMLSYMHDNHINDYNWFMRADDDAYIRVPELISFLSQLDPSEPLYVGSPGTGRKEDLKLIKLFRHEHFCMGGTGVVFSRALLLQLAPHLDECMNKMALSFHDDVEVGRCISRKLNIQCTWSYEMSNLFYNDYSEGAMFKTKKIYRDKTVAAALTMHPFKTRDMMYRIHQFFMEINLKKLDQEKRKVAEELERVRSITNRKRPFS